MVDRKISLFGTELIWMDDPNEPFYPTHDIWLKNGLCMVQQMCNLDKLVKFLFVCLPLKLRGGNCITGASGRADHVIMSDGSTECILQRSGDCIYEGTQLLAHRRLESREMHSSGPEYMDSRRPLYGGGARLPRGEDGTSIFRSSSAMSSPTETTILPEGQFSKSFRGHSLRSKSNRRAARLHAFDDAEKAIDAKLVASCDPARELDEHDEHNRSQKNLLESGRGHNLNVADRNPAFEDA
jgi:hypothetical protein